MALRLAIILKVNTRDTNYKNEEKNKKQRNILFDIIKIKNFLS